MRLLATAFGRRPVFSLLQWNQDGLDNWVQGTYFSSITFSLYVAHRGEILVIRYWNRCHSFVFFFLVYEIWGGRVSCIFFPSHSEWRHEEKRFYFWIFRWNKKKYLPSLIPSPLYTRAHTYKHNKLVSITQNEDHGNL